jgi:hypothetical protein
MGKSVRGRGNDRKEGSGWRERFQHGVPALQRPHYTPPKDEREEQKQLKTRPRTKETQKECVKIGERCVRLGETPKVVTEMKKRRASHARTHTHTHTHDALENIDVTGGGDKERGETHVTPHLTPVPDHSRMRTLHFAFRHMRRR